MTSNPGIVERSAGPLIFLMAGESSGDAIGARLMSALKRETNGDVRFAGIGGERMSAEGLTSDFPMEELSVMGLTEVLPRIPLILRRIRETASRIEALHPAAVVSIDASGFCGRVEKRVKRKRLGIPLIRYVAPMVWAWRPWKAKESARFLDHIMTLLPFEPPYFEKEGLPATFVGHPVIEEGAEQGDGGRFRARHGIPASAPLLALLPGSRRGEIARLLPRFAETVERLTTEWPNLHVVIATVDTVAESVASRTASWPMPVVIVRSANEKYDAFAAANAALAASGTVSLELALARCPMVIAYRINFITAAILRVFLMRVRYATLVNVMLNRPVIPEFLQFACRPERLTEAVGKLLRDPEARRAQIDAVRPALHALGMDGSPPSTRAARTVLRVIAEKTKQPSMA
ncbi:MAG TPA: lipid-A-disaccharide synthase [Alphaproteobacteria bacterium]|nr:lipid-A-disaccharide synthase [Alphaproteobacteria bacterium]